MPAALTVDQGLVDSYLSRADLFFDNVSRLGETLREMTSNLGEKIAPSRNETVQNQAVAQPVQVQPAVVTADDIDVDALLQGIDIDGQGMSR